MKTSWFVIWIAMLLGMISCDNSVTVKKDYWDNGNLKSELCYEDGKLNGPCKWYQMSGKPQWR